MSETRASQTETPPAAPRHRWRWVWRGGALAILVLGLLALPLAFTTTIVPPGELTEAVTVFLVDYGRTPALILPTPEGTMKVYVYGDWDYYALRDTRLRTAAIAMFWPTPGTIGYRTLDGPPTTESIRRQINLVIHDIHEIPVERTAVDRLIADLDALIAERRDAAHFQPQFNQHFVPHPMTYTYFHNSNHRVAAWLHELGCETHGPAFYSHWRVKRPEG